MLTIRLPGALVSVLRGVRSSYDALTIYLRNPSCVYFDAAGDLCLCRSQKEPLVLHAMQLQLRNI